MVRNGRDRQVASKGSLLMIFTTLLLAASCSVDFLFNTREKALAFPWSSSNDNPSSFQDFFPMKIISVQAVRLNIKKKKSSQHFRAFALQASERRHQTIMNSCQTKAAASCSSTSTGDIIEQGTKNPSSTPTEPYISIARAQKLSGTVLRKWKFPGNGSSTSSSTTGWSCKSSQYPASPVWAETSCSSQEQKLDKINDLEQHQARNINGNGVLSCYQEYHPPQQQLLDAPPFAGGSCSDHDEQLQHPPFLNLLEGTPIPMDDELVAHPHSNACGPRFLSRLRNACWMVPTSWDRFQSLTEQKSE